MANKDSSNSRSLWELTVDEKLALLRRPVSPTCTVGYTPDFLVTNSLPPTSNSPSDSSESSMSATAQLVPTSESVSSTSNAVPFHTAKTNIATTFTPSNTSQFTDQGVPEKRVPTKEEAWTEHGPITDKWVDWASFYQANSEVLLDPWMEEITQDWKFQLRVLECPVTIKACDVYPTVGDFVALWKKLDNDFRDLREGDWYLFKGNEEKISIGFFERMKTHAGDDSRTDFILLSAEESATILEMLDYARDLLQPRSQFDFESDQSDIDEESEKGDLCPPSEPDHIEKPTLPENPILNVPPASGLSDELPRAKRDVTLAVEAIRGLKETHRREMVWKEQDLKHSQALSSNYEEELYKAFYAVEEKEGKLTSATKEITQWKQKLENVNSKVAEMEGRLASAMKKADRWKVLRAMRNQALC